MLKLGYVFRSRETGVSQKVYSYQTHLKTTRNNRRADNGGGDITSSFSFNSRIRLGSAHEADLKEQTNLVVMQSRDQPTTQDWHIPVVDISEINEDTGKAVVDAAASHGFLYITGENLGFDAAIIDRMFSLV